METKHIRKLLQVYHTSGDDPSFQNTTSSPPLTPPPQPGLTSLDSTMALTIFVLLIALFFMGFFSVYIRHFADDSMDEISSRTRRRRSSTVPSPRRPSVSIVSRPFSSWRGLDSQAIRSLPVYRYKKEAKQKIEDCVICLSEFEDGETVKVIPNCGHVFHVDCVDTWLTSHVTCPFCRNSQLFSDKGLEMQEPEGNSRRSAAEDYDTCRCTGPCLRRCSSCSSLGQRSRLERSLSL